MRVFTAQISRRRIQQTTDLNITVKSASTPIGKLLAPTWDMVMGYKNGTISEDEYTKQYRHLLSRRFNSNERNNQILREFMARDSVTLLCYCQPGAFCHRRLLCFDILPRVASHVGVEYEAIGETGNVHIR